MSELLFTTLNAFLHHGIQGQKWGVQNGPPYPLGPDKSTGKRLKKSTITKGRFSEAQYNSNAGEYLLNSLMKDSKINPPSQETLNDQDSNYDYRLGFRFGNLNSYEASPNSGRTIASDKEVPVTLTNKGLKNTAELLDEPYWPKTNKVDNFDDAFSRMDVNPRYDPDNFSSGFDNNCNYCSVAEVLRFMGYEDITARPSRQGLDQKDQKLMFNGLKQLQTNDDGGSKEEVEAQLAKLSDKSFGTIGAFGNGGHAFNYFKDNGEVVFIDAQTGKIHNSLDDFNSQCGWGAADRFIAYDMTNATPNLTEIGKFGVIQDDRLSSGNKGIDIAENIGESYILDYYDEARLMDDWRYY